MRTPGAVTNRVNDLVLQNVHQSIRRLRRQSCQATTASMCALSGGCPRSVLFSKFGQHAPLSGDSEHLNEADGRAYLEIVEREARISAPMGASRSRHGQSPATYVYDRIERISPTTLRYVKVA